MVKRVTYRGDGASVVSTFRNAMTVKLSGKGHDDEEDGAFYDGKFTVTFRGATVSRAGFLRSYN